MIKNFSVENFQSIKDRLDVSFSASVLDDDTSFNNCFNFKGTDIFKVVSFYGMNASGKSTIIKSMSALKHLVAPIENRSITSLLPYSPFKFSDDTKHSPTSFGVEFSLNNTDEDYMYKYFIKYNESMILEEKLEKLTSQKYSLLFHRTVDENGKSSINLGNIISGLPLLQALIPSVIPNKSFLSMFDSFKVEDLYDAYSFFKERFMAISPEITKFHDFDPRNIENDEKYKTFLLKLLNAADFNIQGFHVARSKNRRYFGTPNGLIEERKSLYLEHKVNYDDKSIEFIEESLGTKKMIILGAQLYYALSKASVLAVDELESSLHPELTKLIVTLFLDETINTFNSQLIFTSHETTLLNLSLLRRDQINFVYKDEKSCGTFVRSLKDYQVRKNTNIAKAYLAGRFSTSPNVNENIFNED